MHSTSRLKYLCQGCRLIFGILGTQARNTPFRVRVRSANHLREVDDYRLCRRPTDKDVEFVEVSVNETRSSKPYNEVHEGRI